MTAFQEFCFLAAICFVGAVIASIIFGVSIKPSYLAAFLALGKVIELTRSHQ